MSTFLPVKTVVLERAAKAEYNPASWGVGGKTQQEKVVTTGSRPNDVAWKPTGVWNGCWDERLEIALSAGSSYGTLPPTRWFTHEMNHQRCEDSKGSQSTLPAHADP